MTDQERPEIEDRVPDQEQLEAESIAEFKKISEEFVVTLRQLKSVSGKLKGRRTRTPEFWGSILLYRMVINGETLVSLWAEKKTLDHYSIAVVARSMIETGIMLFYITEPGKSDEEWHLRQNVLYLHDCIARLRLYQAIGNEEQVVTGREIAEILRTRISGNPVFQAMKKADRKKLLSGKILYVRGLRAVLRSIGFPDQWLDIIYGQLSAYTHAAPFSYARPEARRLDDLKSPYAHYVAAESLRYVRHIMLFVIIRFHKIEPCAWCRPFDEAVDFG
jgi:hypothetical protein